MKNIAIILVLLTVGLFAYACGGGNTTTLKTDGLANSASDILRGASYTTELIYASNGAWDGIPKGLYKITIDDVNKTATGTIVNNYSSDWGGAHIGASLDGAELYCHQNGGKFGIYNATLGGPGLVTTNPVGVTQAATDPYGVFYVGNQNNDILYTVDLATGALTSQGYIYAGPGMTNKIDLSGGDIVFDAAGTFYLLTNYGKGLYSVTEETDGVNTWYEGEALWAGRPTIDGVANAPYSGIAIRDNGMGDLVATLQLGKGLLVIDRENGYSWERYNWTGNYSHDQGDMSVGRFGDFPTETAWGDGERFGKGWATIFTLADSPVVFYAGQDINVGTVTAYTDENYLYVEYNVTGTWELVESHLYVGTTIPNKSAPGLFPYNNNSPEYDEDTQTYTIPLDDLSDNPYIAAHGVVQNLIG